MHDCSDECTRFPLSYGQRAMWLYERLHPGSVAHHLAYAFQIPWTVDIEALIAAMQLVLDRHPMLRATFDEVDGIPLQTVHLHQVVEWSLESATGWTDSQLSDRLSTEAARPFDLSGGPLIRFGVLSRTGRGPHTDGLRTPSHRRHVVNGHHW